MINVDKEIRDMILMLTRIRDMINVDKEIRYLIISLSRR